MAEQSSFRFSGHETFSCRYAWLPKAVSALRKNPEIFSDEDAAMVELGVGKNMVRAIRFWVQATGVAEPTDRRSLRVTPIGKEIFGTDGQDPFMEDSQTLWLLHWQISTQFDRPLYAWDYLLNRWHRLEFTRSEVLRTFLAEASKAGWKLSSTTLAHHVDTFIHTYVPTQGHKGVVTEDNLDCPLVELRLIQRVGEREADSKQGRREPIYAFRHEPKPEISHSLFAYCVADFFARKHPAESTLAFREIAHGHGSPGQVFKLPENELRERCEALADSGRCQLVFEESANIQQVRRQGSLPTSELCKAVYGHELVNA